MTLDGKAIFHTAHSNLLSAWPASIDPTISSSVSADRAGQSPRADAAPEGSAVEQRSTWLPLFITVPPFARNRRPAVESTRSTSPRRTDEGRARQWVRSLVPACVEAATR